MIEVPTIFKCDDFMDDEGIYLHPDAMAQAAQDRFEEWFEATFSRRVWIKGSDIVTGIDVYAKVYEPETMKELPQESLCSEFWEVRKR